MKQQLLFNYKKITQISDDSFEKVALGRHLRKEIENIESCIEKQYKTPYASLYCCFDKNALKSIKNLVKEKQKLQVTVLIVIGIGGSSLGTKAIQEAIFGRYYNSSNPPIKIYFAQTVDADKMTKIIGAMQEEFAKGNHVLITVITKSGTTTETIANFYVLLSLLKKQYPETYSKYVVCITDKNSSLWNMSKKEHFSLLEVPKNVGGRYSVFSSVGLFPLAMVGIDIEKLVSGAKQGLGDSFEKDIFKNPAIMSALSLYIHYKKGLIIHDLFLFSTDLESVGKWYRQLMGESIGKEKDIYGKKVMVGITPTVSLGSIDLHSVAQLYLGGPRDKMTTFITVKKMNTLISVPKDSSKNDFTYLQGKTFKTIMKAIVDGTKKAYQKNKRPFCSFQLAEKNEYCLGQFMQIKMIEMMYLGYLLEVNPFDQPNVELYKKETHQILSK